MDQDGVGAGLGGRFEQREAGGHAADDRSDFGPAFDLQAVWAIVAKPVNIERLLKVFCKFFPAD
ncbi:hypothetical protein NCCP691_34970 [Noviherbaspirillum aridicola]|uniref:Uncharacterized protein n=1 Tax=Noviherbaspirillum aridicola TaxID=2849687 RepID=A0ABQ4Q8F8_9BURK|nr:hypothetical protein NCCP691_34970 [Noviherbaspirillum aridicola]